MDDESHCSETEVSTHTSAKANGVVSMYTRETREPAAPYRPATPLLSHPQAQVLGLGRPRIETC